MKHNDVGSFLRARREALRPADVGLVAGGRRRTPGLRRSEVALLANVSVDYYERLEQSRNAHPSQAMLASLARALRLSVDERDHLYRLAGYAPPLSGSTGGYVDPAMMFLLDALTTVPAHVVDDLNTVLAQNRLSQALVGSWRLGDERAGNVTWRWFTDPGSRALNLPEEHEAIGRGYTADLRAAAARRGGDAVSERLIADLLGESEEFARYWDDMAVEPLRSTRKHLIHPHAGPLDVQCDFVLSSTTGHRLVIFRPQPGSTTADNFAFLHVLGEQTFDG
ncbi:helix-turn-helix transcriptional regulator [Nonomuraea aridisoli]|uniref:Transcriptional regulator n=1 Tax=Nonomuraea aridisoli TaxID=2070368 RepID=A0A2W2EY02_9ACTN|nr:helix-turn-helix transcriptional regulator [Nonomuraea aridisoli]PZG21749.1 transcriptional regulator [Nonomuraea aridisoli]